MLTNNFTAIGRLAAKPVEGKGAFVNRDGSITVKFKLYADHDYKNRDGKVTSEVIECTQYIPAGKSSTVWEYINTGDLVGVQGHLSTDTYKKGGIDVYELTANVDRITLMPNNRKGSTDGTGEAPVAQPAIPSAFKG